MDLVYTDTKTEEQGTSLKAAKKLFGGNQALANSLLARINAMKQADTIKDIIVHPTFHFHKLENKGGRNLEETQKDISLLMLSQGETSGV